MNEYIILNICSPSEEKCLIKVDNLVRWKSVPNTTMDGHKNPTFLLQTNDAYFYVKESLSEIEALIMGTPFTETTAFCLDSVPSAYVNSKLKEAHVDLCNEMQKIREENAILKEENEKLAANQRVDNWQDNVMLGPLNAHQLRDRLEHSNPANPCCRETFIKLEGMSVVLTHGSQEIKWYESFIKAINSINQKGENNAGKQK